MNLDQLCAKALERIHRSIGQRARWAMHDFRLKLNELRDQHRLLYSSEIPPMPFKLQDQLYLSMLNREMCELLGEGARNIDLNSPSYLALMRGTAASPAPGPYGACTPPR